MAATKLWLAQQMARGRGTGSISPSYVGSISGGMSGSLSMRYGTATSDSHNGWVQVKMDMADSSISCIANTPITEGQRVAVLTTSSGQLKAIPIGSNIVDIAITDVDVQYALSSSSTVAPTTGWTSTPPSTIPDGQYLWQRTATTTGSGTSYSAAVCITSADGKDGRGVENIQEQYYLSTSSTRQTGGSWQYTCPEWKSDHYIWTRSQITWTDRTVTYTTPVLASALNQANEKAEVSTWYTFADEEGTHVVSTPNDATTGPNVLLNGYNLVFRDGTEELASFSPEEFEMLSFFIRSFNGSVSIGGNNLVIGSKPPTTSGWDMESVGVKELVQRCAAMHVEVFGDIASTATNTWAEGVFYTGNNNIVTFNTGTVMNVDSRRRIYIQQTGVYKVSLYGAVYSCSAGDLCHFGLGTDAGNILVDAQQNMNGNWGTIAKTALMRVTEPDIYLKPFYKCEQGYGSKLASDTSSVTIEYLGVG